MIDLHTHTTASDGRCTPADLVSRASAAGIRVLAVTDHDTMAAADAVHAACVRAGIEFVSGIEITAVRDGLDVHMLGYFLDARSRPLAEFLSEQRRRRVERVRMMIDRLRELGMPLDADTILEPANADPTRSAGRPWIARALIAGGHVASSNEAFSRWLGRGRPAFVPRLAAPPEEVVGRIHDAGGIASIAHPGLLAEDSWLPGLVAAGLDAIEAYHSDHDPAKTMRYVAMAESLKVAVSGGSDYHADPSHGGRVFGTVSLPQEDYQRLKAKAEAGRHDFRDRGVRL